MKKKKMGIIKNVLFGLHERVGVGLCFNLFIDGNVGTIEYLGLEQSIELIKSYQVNHTEQLDGKPCLVEHDEENRTIRYLEPLIIK